MKRINILNEDTANKIAAGEVVERPSSVVKELVENSIDAGSKNITIEIEDGGISLIRIIDDGDGIYKDDIKKAFMPHATSKIAKLDDIYGISTLGFRGEALPSIASVAKVNLKSKILNSEYGYEINIKGGKFGEVCECGTNKGTIIEVRDLFFNVPARKKFLKSISKEGSLINDIITRISIANPDISFKLFNNHKKVIHTFGNNDIKDTLRIIYGKSITDNILYFEDSSDLITIHGYVGKEEISRGSRNNQSIFVNKRYIKSRSLAIAVEQAFKSFSTVNKFPFFVLFIEIYPEYIDVNIHPTKAEVKFNDERMIFKKIFTAVHNSLKNDIFKSFAIEDEIKNIETVQPSFEEITFKIKQEEDKVKLANNLLKEAINNGGILKSDKSYVSSSLNKEDIKKCVLKDSNIINNSVDIPVTIKDNFKNNYEVYDKSDINSIDYYKNEIIPSNTISKNNNIKTDVINEPLMSNYNSLNQSDNVNYDNDIRYEKKNAKFPPISIIGQYNKTYILGEYDGTLYMIDQHAAHEKMYFEKYIKDIESGNIIVQPLIIPSVIDLTVDDYSYFKENKGIFKEAGFTLEEFGGTSIALKEVPYFLGKLNPKKLFIEILDNLKNLGNGKTIEVKHNAIATKACKSAIKGNDELQMSEMVKLIEDLRYIDDPFHCPHGRPIIIKFTSTDIDKKFKRI